jgi:hypothetical protein
VDLSKAEWRKSSRSNDTGHCVQIATNLPGVVAMRDSKNPVLVFPPAEWSSFISNLRSEASDS